MLTNDSHPAEPAKEESCIGDAATAEVSIVLVTYNCADWLGRCVGALPAALRGRTAQIVVVDNASHDDSAALAARYEHVLLIRNDENVGFATAVNQGVDASSARWVLLLNPDTEPSAGSIDSLMSFADAHPSNLIYGGRTLTEDGRVDPHSCWGLQTVWSAVCFGLGLNTVFAKNRVFDPESLGTWQRDSTREVGMVSGCLLLVRRETWEVLGGLDEQFFVYGEDADFNARARRMGARPIITPTAQIVHAKAVSSAESHLPLLLAGKITYARKHFSPVNSQLVIVLLRNGTALRALGSHILRRETIWTGAWRRRHEWWAGFAADRHAS